MDVLAWPRSKSLRNSNDHGAFVLRQLLQRDVWRFLNLNYELELFRAIRNQMAADIEQLKSQVIKRLEEMYTQTTVTSLLPKLCLMAQSMTREGITLLKLCPPCTVLEVGTAQEATKLVLDIISNKITDAQFLERMMLEIEGLSYQPNSFR